MREAEAAAILKELEELRQTDYVDGYFMAFLHHALGEPHKAFEELDRAVLDRSPVLFMMDVDPRMDGLRTDPRFARLRNKIFRSHAAQKIPALTRESLSIAPYTAKDSTPRHRAAS